MKPASSLALAFLVFSGVLPATAATLEAGNDAELTAALPKLKTGDTLKIGPGTYHGGYQVSRVEKLTVEAADPKQPPLFKGGNHAWQFVRCPQLTVRHLRFQSQTDNGINLDDGGERESPIEGITLEDLDVSDTGPDGNFDAIKCSGLDHLTIRRCSISGWGGQAIDLVGCHDVLIRECRITGKPGFSQHTGPQFKGGCRRVTIEKCEFTNAGPRPIHVGGSTGLDYFRPPGANYEAADIIVRDNIIQGGECACAFTGVDGAEFSGNTIRNPDKWIFRILQENITPGFLTCGNVKISNNTIVFRRADIGSEINIGEHTAPETFRFEGNHWLAEDKPEASKPKLPTEETGGVYGQK